MATERRLEAHQVEAIFRAFAEVMRELPPDTEAGWLDGNPVFSKFHIHRTVALTLRRA